MFLAILIGLLFLLAMPMAVQAFSRYWMNRQKNAGAGFRLGHTASIQGENQAQEKVLARPFQMADLSFAFFLAGKQFLRLAGMSLLWAWPFICLMGIRIGYSQNHLPLPGYVWILAAIGFVGFTVLFLHWLCCLMESAYTLGSARLSVQRAWFTLKSAKREKWLLTGLAALTSLPWFLPLGLTGCALLFLFFVAGSLYIAPRLYAHAKERTYEVGSLPHFL